MAEYSNARMTVGDVEMTVTTRGPENEAEKVHMHTIDEAAKAMQAFDEGKHPDKCDGQMFSVAWNEVFGEE